MDIHVLFFVVGLFNFIQADGRLIQRNKTKNIEEIHTDKPNPVIRLTRDVFSDLIDGFPKEERFQSDEFTKIYIRKTRNFDKEPTASPKSYNVTRIARDGKQSKNSKENVKEKTSTTIKQLREEAKPKKGKPLVKKPIPKFNEADYEDFQSMMNKVHTIADSGDREDEDFNISDYDFDVNHDEYTSAGGRKHFEPRMRIKNIPNQKYEKQNTLSNVEESVINTKKPSNKKERSAEDPKQTDQSRDTDYYDESNDETTKGQLKGPVRETQDDQYNDENEDKESNKTKPPIRKVRSLGIKGWKAGWYYPKKNT